MGVLIEVRTAPDRENRFLVLPGNTYSGPTSTKFTSLKHACVKVRGGWTGVTSLEIAQRVFDDFLNAANSGTQPEYFKSIRVLPYHNDPNQRSVILPRHQAILHNPHLRRDSAEMNRKGNRTFSIQDLATR